jgi:FixJ family two-component response regulator
MNSRKLIVLVEDDESMLRALERGLRVRGYDTEGFSSATDFLDRARLDKSRCLVLDINLKHDSGIDLACRLKQIGHSVPIIFMTGCDCESTRLAAVRTGCTAYLRKPFAFGNLVQAIEQAGA